MTPDSPKEFNFDFQVDQSQAGGSRRVADDAPSTGSGRGNGADGAATPPAPDDLDAPARAGNGDAPPSSSPRRRRKADPGDGDGYGRSSRGNGRAGRAKRRRFEPEQSPELIRSEDDWLGFTDGEAGGDVMQSFPSSDEETGSGPRVPREGRRLAKAARVKAAERRADGRSRADDQSDVPFESLRRQPQKRRASRTRTPLLDAVRDAAGAGAARLRDGAQRVRHGAANLREDGAERLRELKPQSAGEGGDGDGNGGPPDGRPPHIPKIAARRPRRPKPGRIKKLRLVVVLAGLGVLAIVAMFFGMMMAIARDIPALENLREYQAAQNSEVYDNHGRLIGTLLNNNDRLLLSSDQISPYIKEATVAIEDERFYEHRGVDVRGIFRAAVADILPGGSTQGASTITQQFVKNALEAQGNRTVLQKFREAAIAYHLERQWDKDKILTEYLNTIYFGEGAYGIEAAAHTYFGYNHPGCGTGSDPCASELEPQEAAMLAGLISSPSLYSPKGPDPQLAMDRRNLVLSKMADQGILTGSEYSDAVDTALPAPSDIQKPKEDSKAPYFTSWLRQLVVDKYGAGRAFSGGLDIHSTLDLDMQDSATQIAHDALAGVQPTASVVVLDNETGEIRAMVGGPDFEKQPFNIATQGVRQPGSTFKAFILAAALERGISPDTVYASQQKTFTVPGSGGKEHFTVKNYEGNYLGSCSITCATTYSDNSIYAELGIEDVGTSPIAHMARDMGIQSDVSHNPAMVLGAPSNCCGPLEMTHAFETIAAGGERVSGNFDTIPGDSSKDPRDDGPVPIKRVSFPDGKEDVNKTITTRVLDAGAASTEKSILETVVSGGTGTNAQGPPDAWGKTGTTEDYGNAWFCGGSTHFTACVWVGYPTKVIPMETEYGGSPVAGGTYPAEIWSRVMSSVEAIYAAYGSDDSYNSDTTSSSGYVAPSTSSGGSSSSSSSSSSSGGGGNAPAPAAPAPAPSSGGGGAPSSGGGVGL